MSALLLLGAVLAVPWVQGPSPPHLRQTQGAPTRLERAILDRAAGCVRARLKPNLDLLLDMLRAEERAGVPRRLRGMSLAAACSESGFDPEAKGDRRFDKRGRPRAIGILQMWSWYEARYHVDRRKPVRATEAWLAHIVTHLEPTRRRCGRHLRGEALWVKAWVHAVRAPSRRGRCDQIPKHYLRLKRWRRAWRALL